ncbi:MAG TPA: DUF11 domain-containing protein [Oligoflexia bacterium]|nr:DUF11 domain-containing protein [Oligoflexia bacterium]HMP27131.1 DUF11 domain-containing protein [Oligoflexia bacterium]
MCTNVSVNNRTIATTLLSAVLLLLILSLVFEISTAFAQQCNSQVGSNICSSNVPHRRLSGMCGDNPSTTNILEFSWTYSHANPTGAACAYIDTDGDGNANFAACARIDNASSQLFTCNDTSNHTCPGFSAVSSSLSCSVSASTVSCTLNKTDVGGAPVLINTCSHTSNDVSSPNGTCVTCIFESGSIRIEKTAYDYNGNLVPAGSAPVFQFQITGDATVNTSVLGSGTTTVGFSSSGATPRTYNVFESVPVDWTATGASCVSSFGNTEGTNTNNSVSGIQLTPGEAVVCSFTNQQNDPAAPSLHIEKSANTTTYATVGQEIEYSYTVTNSGNVTINGIAVWDDKICPDATPCISCASATLAAGGSTACGPAAYVVTQADIDNGQLVNVARARGLHNNNPVTSNDDQVVLDAVQTNQILTTKSGAFNDLNDDTLANPGETISYTITVTNTGNTTATIVAVNDPLLPDLALNCDQALPAVLAPGAQIVCTGDYVITQADIDRTYVTNVVSGCATFPLSTDEVCRDAETQVTLPYGDSGSIVKNGKFDPGDDDLAQPGELIYYTIFVTNTGNRTAVGVVVVDPLLGGGLVCDKVQPVDLPPGGSIYCEGSYAVTQADIDAGFKDNTATATFEESGIEISDTENVPLPTRPDLNIEKTGVFNDENQDGYGQAGETISYTIVVANTGNVTLSSVSVSDPIVAPLNCSPSTPVDFLAPGEVITCTAEYVLQQADLDQLNKANIASAEADQVKPRQDDFIVYFEPTPTPTPTLTPTGTPTSTPTVVPTAIVTATPVVVARCTGTSLLDTQFLLDGISASQASVAQTIVNAVGRSKKATKKEKSSAKKSLTDISKLKSAGWILAWSLPQVVQNCDPHPTCSSVSLQSTVSQYTSNTEALYKLTLNLLKRFGGKFLTKSRVKTINRNALKFRALGIQTIGQIPLTHNVCG